MKPATGELPPHVTAIIANDEVLLTYGWARVQRSRTGRGTVISIHVFVEIFDGLRNRSMMRKLKARSAASGIPLERNMALCLTNERLLTFRARAHPRRIGTYLGEIARSRIVSARFPFTPSGPWPTVELRTTDGFRIRLKISATAAEVVVAELRGAA